MSANTPGIQSRSQFHHYWGLYAGATNLPNASGNPIVSPEFDKLEAGDLAFNSDNALMYVCIDAGTSGGGDAQWRPFRGGDRYYAQDNTSQSTSSTSPQVALSTSPSVDGGVYVARWYAEVQSGVLAANIQTRFRIDGTDRANVIFDSTLLNVWQYSFSGIVQGSFTSGAHTFEITFERNGGLLADSVSIRRCRIEVEKVG